MNRPPLALKFENVSKAYRQAGDSEDTEAVPVLKDASLELASGEIVALYGRSGSGKTTLLNLAAGLDRPDAGTIRLNDRDMTNAPELEWAGERRSRLGLVFQRFLLQEKRTPVENVMLPMLAGGRRPDEARDAAENALDLVGLAAHAEKRVGQLSGGQQQRVALARALAQRPQLILADEPTGNLDAQTATEMLELFKQLQTQQGVGFLIATHDDLVLDTAAHVLELTNQSLKTASG